MSKQRFLEYRQAFEAIETSMGETSSLLSEVALALSDHPDGLRFDQLQQAFPSHIRFLDDAIVVSAEEWPTAADIQKLLTEWHSARAQMLSTWTMLMPDEQAEIGPPVMTGRNLLHAVL